MASENRCPKCGSEMVQGTRWIRDEKWGRGHEEIVPGAWVCREPKNCRIIELQRESATFKATAQGLLNFQKQDRERIAELESLLRASEARELVLRDALMDYGRHIQSIPELGIVGCDFDPEIGATCTCGLRPALSNTSAIAQRVKDEIERDVREAVWDKVKDMWGASPMQFRAAILGEKENN